MTLSDRLREAMTDAGMNQRELADACNVKPPSVNGWLSGKAKFLRGENLLRAAMALDVSDQWLATGKPPKARKAASQQHSQSVRLDSRMLAETAKALRLRYAKAGGYDIEKDPEIFAIAYEIRSGMTDAYESPDVYQLVIQHADLTPQGAGSNERGYGAPADAGAESKARKGRGVGA